jgi:replicative DNA helicase
VSEYFPDLNSSESTAQKAVRIPPQDLAAERSLLGAMLLTRDAIADAMEVCTAEQFYRPAHGHIFEAISSLYGAGEPADTVTVADELDRAGLLETIGGPSALIDLQASTPAATNASRYADIIYDHYILRALIRAAGDISELGYSKPDDVTKAVDSAETLMFDVAQGRVVDSMAEIKDLLKGNLDRLEELYEQGDSITGTPTGYRDLDEMMSGMQNSSLIVIGARPAMGKTSFALGAVVNAAMGSRDYAGKPCLFFSLEMGQLEISQRMLCADAKVDASRVRTGQLDPNDWQKISNSVGRLAEAAIWIDDNPNLTIMDIRSKARRLKSRVGPLGMICVDYIQLMTGRSGAESRQVEISEISRGLKILARELECPVVALSQLSRGLESRQDKRPMLADLRESGAIEQDADVVMFLYRDEVYNPETEHRNEAEVIIAKHRNGPTGTSRLVFVPKFTRFENMAKGV